MHIVVVAASVARFIFIFAFFVPKIEWKKQECVFVSVSTCILSCSEWKFDFFASAKSSLFIFESFAFYLEAIAQQKRTKERQRERAKCSAINEKHVVFKSPAIFYSVLRIAFLFTIATSCGVQTESNLDFFS